MQSFEFIQQHSSIAEVEETEDYEIKQDIRKILGNPQGYGEQDSKAVHFFPVVQFEENDRIHHEYRAPFRSFLKLLNGNNYRQKFHYLESIMNLQLKKILVVRLNDGKGTECIAQMCFETIQDKSERSNDPVRILLSRARCPTWENAMVSQIVNM